MVVQQKDAEARPVLAFPVAPLAACNALPGYHDRDVGLDFGTRKKEYHRINVKVSVIKGSSSEALCHRANVCHYAAG